MSVYDQAVRDLEDAQDRIIELESEVERLKKKARSHANDIDIARMHLAHIDQMTDRAEPCTDYYMALCNELQKAIAALDGRYNAPNNDTETDG